MQPSRASLRAKRSNPERFTRNLDCFVASLLANDEADFDLDQFHHNRGRFAAADAQAGDAARLAVALERGDQRRDDARAAGADRVDRKSVVEGKGASVRVDLGGPRIIKKKKKTPHH